MDRQKNSAVFDPAFIALGLVLWNAHPDQRPDQTAYRTADAQPCQRAHNRTGYDQRTDARNCKRPDTSQQA